ncbi:ABC transporter permease [Sinosporangium siamense]|uniref:Amino acid ABC transporter permease n=1 Tax=Sinosporangium siamense TaxID=1367973 RepID=A0A919RAU5_9ACTN|nr:ABC transporter permease [Sinosporangium siamense]GII90508.1 amino acid ABC transporter permease [Sinosporangium siamense]
MKYIKVAGVVVFLLLWQLAGQINPGIYSSPTLVVTEIVRLFTEGGLLGLVFGTVATMLLGWAFAAVIGVFTGFLIGRYRLASLVLEPYLVALYSVPLIAVVPLLVIWFGIGQTFLLATIVVATGIMLVFPTAAGTRETVRVYDQVARAYCVSGRHFLFKVLLPGALPFIATGMRISVQRALMAVIVGQFLVGHPGLGTLLSDARVRLDADEVFAVALVALAVGAALTALVGWADRTLSAWRPEVTS